MTAVDEPEVSGLLDAAYAEAIRAAIQVGLRAELRKDDKEEYGISVDRGRLLVAVIARRGGERWACGEASEKWAHATIAVDFYIALVKPSPDLSIGVEDRDQWNLLKAPTDQEPRRRALRSDILLWPLAILAMLVLLFHPNGYEDWWPGWQTKTLIFIGLVGGVCLRIFHRSNAIRESRKNRTSVAHVPSGRVKYLQRSAGEQGTLTAAQVELFVMGVTKPYALRPPPRWATTHAVVPGSGL